MAGATIPELDRTQLYELVITLLDAGVDIDRRVLVLDGASLADLHLIIQATMGWENYHLHEFTVRDGTTYGDTSIDDEPTYADESGVRLADVLREPGDALDYEYDFGDSWEHCVELVAVRADMGPGAAGMACIGGRGICPPEDCGGVWGYREMCEALADPEAEGHDEWAEWAGLPLPFDPSAFDLAGANQAVRSLALQGRRTQ